MINPFVLNKPCMKNVLEMPDQCNCLDCKIDRTPLPRYREDKLPQVVYINGQKYIKENT